MGLHGLIRRNLWFYDTSMGLKRRYLTEKSIGPYQEVVHAVLTTTFFYYFDDPLIETNRIRKSNLQIIVNCAFKDGGYITGKFP